MKSPSGTETLSPILAAEKVARHMGAAMIAENRQRELKAADRENDRAAHFIAQMGLVARPAEPEQNEAA